jgi:hypothetical protein
MLPLPKRYHPSFSAPRQPLPNNDVELDFTNEFTKYLKYATTSGNGTGAIKDLVGGLTVPGAIRDGRLFTPDGQIDIGVSEFVSDLRPMSVIIRGVITNESSGDSLIRKGASAAANGGWAITVQSGTSNRLAFVKDGSGGDVTLVTGNNVFTSGEVFDLVLRWNGNQASEDQVFIDAAGTTTQGNTPGTYRSDATQTIRIGNANGSVSFQHVLILEKELTFEEGLRLCADPYQVLKPSQAVKYFTPFGVPPSTVIPVIMNQLRNQGIS